MKLSFEREKNWFENKVHPFPPFEYSQTFIPKLHLLFMNETFPPADENQVNIKTENTIRPRCRQLCPVLSQNALCRGDRDG